MESKISLLGLGDRPELLEPLDILILRHLRIMGILAVLGSLPGFGCGRASAQPAPSDAAWLPIWASSGANVRRSPSLAGPRLRRPSTVGLRFLGFPEPPLLIDPQCRAPPAPQTMLLDASAVDLAMS